MKTRKALWMIGMLLMIALSAVAQNGGAKGNYASVNGLKLYYEIHGVGEPLILLHGGVGAIEMFGPNLPALSEKRKVIAVDLQAHGRTADINRPLRYELMADDINKRNRIENDVV